MMNKLLVTGLFMGLLLGSCSKQPETILEEARGQINNSDKFAYKQIAYTPNPMGMYDTLETKAAFQKNTESFIGYDFIIKDRFYDAIQTNGDYKTVNHRSKSVERYTKSEPEVIKSSLENAYFIKRSPLSFLKQTDWQYVKDTTINGQKLQDFSRVEQDKMVEGNRVYTEQHIFINPDSALLERWERRNYFKGDLSQRMIYTFSDYRFDEVANTPEYEFPTDYKSVIYGYETKRTLLKAGQKAPVFTGKDLKNNTLRLEDLRGEKTLLNFSSVGCGHCHEAVKHINRDDFQLPENVTTVYIAPFDQEEKVHGYFQSMPVSYAVVPNAEKIGEAYGVSSTPTFFLIDENGIIEKVVVGYDKEFLEDLQLN